MAGDHARYGWGMTIWEISFCNFHWWPTALENLKLQIKSSQPKCSAQPRLVLGTVKIEINSAVHGVKVYTSDQCVNIFSAQPKILFQRKSY